MNCSHILTAGRNKGNTCSKPARYLTKCTIHRIHPCDHCPMICKTSKSLAVHVAETHETGDYKCPHCAFASDDDNLLQLHINDVHEPTTKYPCPTCDYVTYFPKSITTHNCAGGLSGSRGEVSVKKTLIAMGISYQSECSFDVKNADGNFLRWDFKIDHFTTPLFIEYNGIQHYHAVDDFGGRQQLLRQRNHDKLKRNYCKKHEYPLLTIKYNDIVTVDNLIRRFITLHTDWKKIAPS